MPTREVHGLDDILLTGNLYDQRRTAQRLELIPDQVAANLFVFGVRYGDDIPPDFASEARLDPCPLPGKMVQPRMRPSSSKGKTDIDRSR